MVFCLDVSTFLLLLHLVELGSISEICVNGGDFELSCCNGIQGRMVGMEGSLIYRWNSV